MDLKGKGMLSNAAGSLLLLLVSALVLCQNVASHPTCLSRVTCKFIVQDLYDITVYVSQTMHFHASELFRKFKKQHAQDDFFFGPGIKRCHTADIPAPAGKEEARLMQQTDLINLVLRYLLSWRDVLLQLGLEADRLPTFYHFHSVKNSIISLKHQQLEALTRQIASQLVLEVPEKVNYSLWLEKESLQSSKEETHLFTVYNTLRCFVIDAQKIDFLLSFLKCQAAGEGTC